VIALWFFALGIAVLVTADEWSTWRHIVAHTKEDLDPRPRFDEAFPNLVDDVPKRVAEATKDLESTNHEYRLRVGFRALIVIVLGAVPFAYRRARPPDVGGGAPPSRRAWLLAIPIVIVLAGVAVVLLLRAMRGAITG
jgi:hypothetical protein